MLKRFKPDDPLSLINQLYFELGPQERIIIGIDPGITGAIAFLPTYYRGRPPVILDLPIFQSEVKSNVKGKAKMVTRTSFDFATIGSWLKPAAENNSETLVAIERSQPMVRSPNRCRACGRGFGDTAKTGFSMGISYGMWHLFFLSAGIPIEEFQSSVWKRAAGLLKQGKDASRAAAIKLYPSAHEYFRCKGDHNRAEALLIAEAAKRQRGW